MVLIDHDAVGEDTNSKILSQRYQLKANALISIRRAFRMSRKLIVVSGPETGRTFPLADGQTLVIGRGQASDTKINDPHMSRIHCRLQVDGNQTTILDAGGGGVFVRSEKV